MIWMLSFNNKTTEEYNVCKLYVLIDLQIICLMTLFYLRKDLSVVEPCFFGFLCLYFFLWLWFGWPVPTPSLHSCIAGFGSNSWDAGPSIQICKILLSHCWDKEFLLSVLILFMSEKSLSTFALETGKVNNSFTRSKIDFHSSRLQDSNNLRHTTR